MYSRYGFDKCLNIIFIGKDLAVYRHQNFDYKRKKKIEMEENMDIMISFGNVHD